MTLQERDAKIKELKELRSKLSKQINELQDSDCTYGAVRIRHRADNSWCLRAKVPTETYKGAKFDKWYVICESDSKLKIEKFVLSMIADLKALYDNELADMKGE